MQSHEHVHAIAATAVTAMYQADERTSSQYASPVQAERLGHRRDCSHSNVPGSMRTLRRSPRATTQNRTKQQSQSKAIVEAISSCFDYLLSLLSRASLRLQSRQW